MSDKPYDYFDLSMVCKCAEPNVWFDRTICVRADGKYGMSDICDSCGKEVWPEIFMSDKKEESLKPCPFCGKKAELEDTDNVHLCCIDGDWYLNKKSWNNAYCWKETDSLKARIEDIEKMNSVQKKRIEEAWELNQRYENALKEILDVNTQWGTEIPVKTYGIAKEALGKVCDPGLGAKPIIGC